MMLTDLKKYAIQLREGYIDSLEIEYTDESFTDLFVFLSLNQDICFDGISISLCGN